MADAERIRSKVKYFMTLFYCGSRDVADRFVAAQFDQKSFAWCQTVQGQTGAHECHRADLGCNVKFLSDILHFCHDPGLFGVEQ